MAFSVTAADQASPISRSTDLADALSVAAGVANARGCEAVVTNLATGEIHQTFLPDSPHVDEPVETVEESTHDRHEARNPPATPAKPEPKPRAKKPAAKKAPAAKKPAK